MGIENKKNRFGDQSLKLRAIDFEILNRFCFEYLKCSWDQRIIVPSDLGKLR